MSSIYEETELIFNGLSGTECEAFIRAVRKHAFSMGKARDSGYMADYASTCMDGPALRWFDELDLDTQSDWNKLRSALLAKYPAEYNADSQPSLGSNAPSVFIPTPAAAPPPASPISAPPIPAVPISSSVAGVSENVSSASALPWRYVDDDSSDDDDFSDDDSSGRSPSPPPPPPRLSERQAAPPPPPQIRQRTSSPTRRVDPPWQTAPWPNTQVYGNPQTPSTSRRADPPPSAPAPVRRPMMDTAPRIGRIVVQVEGAGNKKRYLRAKLNQAGFFKCTTSTWNCLRVQYVPSYEPSIIQLLNCDASENLLGITWDLRKGETVPQALGPNSTLSGDVGAVSGAPVVSSSSSSKSGKSGSAIWNVDNRGYIQATWTDDRTVPFGGSWPLDILYMDEWIYIAGNSDSFMRAQDTQIYKKARLYFEAA